MTENQFQPAPQTNTSNRKWIILALGGGCVLVACVVLLGVLAFVYFAPSTAKVFSSVSQNVPSASQTELPGNLIPPQPRQHPQANANTMGDPNAPVKMTEYSDFQCPFCQRYWQDTEPQIVQDYVETGKVLYTDHSAGNWVSQNIGQGSTESQDAAMAAYCAGDQNKFWEYHDALFTNVLGEDAGSFTDVRLKAIAQKLGLDSNQFNSCYDGKKYSNQVAQDFKDAMAAGIQGTPFFVITYTANGQTKTLTIDGAQPYSVFKQALDAALQTH